MLKVECESCKAPYQVDERRVPPTGLKMRCPKCGHTFLVTDPAKGGASGGAADAGGAAKGGPATKKATMVGFGAVPGPGGKPPLPMPGTKPVGAAPAPPSMDDNMALPAVKPAPAKPAIGKATAIGTGPAGPPLPGPPPAALPKLDDLDLPALAGDIGLPSPAAPRAAPGKAPPPAPPPPPGFGFEMDLPAVPAPGGGGFGSIDLPSPATPRGLGGPGSPGGGGGFGDLDLPMAKGHGADLPSAKHGGGGGFGDLPSPKHDPHGGFADLPIVGGPGGGNLPMPKAGGFGEIDLPSLQNDLPQPMGAGAHLPAPMGAGAHLPSPMGAGAHLPAMHGGNLPSPMGAGAHLPSAMSDDRLLPNRSGHAGGGPPPVSFGELDLPLVGGGANPGAPPPARGGDAVSFGELDLPPDPSMIAPAGGGMGGGAGGGMGFGEVDLGGGGDAGPVMGPPPATSAGSFAFQEAALPETGKEAPAKQRPQAVERPPSKAPKILALVVALVVVGGAALQLVPGVGAFGHVIFGEYAHKGEYAQKASKAVDAANASIAVDTYAAYVKAADDLAEQRKKYPRSKPLATTAAFFEYMNQVRFGSDPARSARAKTFLADIPPNEQVPYFNAALAAEAAAGDLPKAKRFLDQAIMKDPKDGIRLDLAILKGEIALAEKDHAAAVSAFTEAASIAPSARTHFGLARAHYMGKSFSKARESVDATLKASATHAGGLTLRALLTWELQRDDATALKDLSVVLADPARKNEGSSEVSGALAAKGWIMQGRERASEARAAFDEAVKIDPRNVSALVGQGEVLYQDSRYTEALTRFEEATRKDATSVQAVIGSAKSKIALERLADAKGELAAARAKWPKDMGIALWLARCEESLGNKKVAEELYGVAVDLADAQNPDAISAFAAYARFLNSQGRENDAQVKLDQARSKLPDTPAVQRAFGEVAASQGKNEQAVGHFQAALEKNPLDLGTRFRLGQTYRKMNALDKSAEEFDKVVAIDKDYPGIALERGVLFEKSGDVQKALESFNAALQKAPNETDLKLRVGAAYVAIGDTEKAIPLLKQVYEQRPNSAEANHFLGRAYLKQGGLEATAAMRYLQRAVDLDPNKGEYHLYVAWAANEQSPAQIGLARKHVEKALALDKTLADGYWQRGLVELREGSYGDAVKDLRKALELKPDRIEAHAALAEAFEKKNDNALAMQEWAKAISGDDKQAAWRYQYGRLLADKNQNAEAAKHLAFAVEKGKTMQPRPGWLFVAAFEAAEAQRKTGKKTEACESYKLYMELSPPTHPDRRDAEKGMKDSGCPQER
jgi:cellulose synthase operon protein C